MNYQNQYNSGQSYPVGQQCVATLLPKTASPLATEIHKLQEEVSILEVLRDELLKLLQPVIAEEPTNPKPEGPGDPPVNLAEVPNTVKLQRVRIQCLNETLRTLLRTVQV